MKTCSKCQTTKPLTEFYADRRPFGDGYRHICKACFPRTGGKPTPIQRAMARRARGETHAEYRAHAQIQADAIERAKLREAERQWHAMNRAMIRAATPRPPHPGTLAWMATRTPAQIAAWRHKFNARARRRYAANPKPVLDKKKRHKARNPRIDKRWIETRRDRAKGQCDGTLTIQAVRALFAASTICPYCEEVMQAKSMDHVIPLAKGGAHSIRNVVICCRPCNSAKTDLLPLIFIWRRAAPTPMVTV